MRSKPRRKPTAPRPRTRGKVMGTPILVRVQPDQLVAIDKRRSPGMSRADVIREAIRRLEERLGAAVP